MRRFVLAAIALTVLAACQPASTELTEQQKAEIEAAVRMVVEDQYAAARETDIERVLSHTSQEDGLCVFGPTVRACSEVYARYREAWGTDRENRLERQEFDGEDIRVMALSPTIAIMARAVEEARGYYTNGDVSRWQSATLAVYVLEDGEWKAQSVEQSSWPIEDEEGGEN